MFAHSMIQNPNALGSTTLVAKRYKNIFYVFVFKREMYQIVLLCIITGPAEGVFFCGGRESVGIEGHLKGWVTMVTLASLILPALTLNMYP